MTAPAEDKALTELRHAHYSGMAGVPMPTPPDSKGRIIVARSHYPQGKTTWLRPGAPGWWMVWLLASRHLLRHRHIHHIEVHYTLDQEPKVHEYRLMTPEQMDEANARWRPPSEALADES